MANPQQNKQPPKSPGAILQHMSSNIAKLLEVIEDVKAVSSENESWATIPTNPRIATTTTVHDVSVQDVSPAKDPVDILPHLKLMAVLLASITSVVSMLSAALARLIEIRKREHEMADSEDELPPPKKAKKGREKKDFLADDGSHIVIITSKHLPDIISDQYFVVNLNNSFKKFSTRFVHMEIPIPFMRENRVGRTVEGIWQGLQVFDTEDADASCMIATTPRSLVRKVKGKLKGWRKGLRGDGILSLVEARKQILMVMYKYVLEKKLKKEVQQIQQKMSEDKIILIVCEGAEQGWNIEDENVPFGAAGMLRLYLLENKL